MANLHLDNSESSAAEDREDILSSGERNVRILAKQMLEGRIFLGHFQEKRYVESLQAYRDVIVVKESEVKLKNDIDAVRNRLKQFYNRNCWIGITDPTFIGAPHGYCFWIESNNNKFGYYWYRIRSVRFRRKEILVRLKEIRPMTDVDEIQTLDNKKNEVTLDEIIDNLKNSIRENTVWFFTEALTAQNIKEALTFLSILIVTVATSIFYGIAYFMDFILKLMREISVFVQAITPFMIAVVNLVGKIIGGLYLFLAMLFTGNTSQRMQKIAPPSGRYKAIDMPSYHNRNPVIITEIE